MHGISDIGSGRLFIVKPYGLTGFTNRPPSTAGTGLTPGTNPLLTAGLYVKLGLRSNVVANFTVNADFAALANPVKFSFCLFFEANNPVDSEGMEPEKQ